MGGGEREKGGGEDGIIRCRMLAKVAYFSAMAYSPALASLSRIRNTPSLILDNACSA